MRQRQRQKLSFGKFQQIVELQVTLAFKSTLAALAAGEQLAKPAVSRTIAWESQDIRRTVDEDEPRSDQKLRFEFEGGIIELLVGPHDAGHRVVIGDADGAKAQMGRLVHVILRVRATPQE